MSIQRRPYLFLSYRSVEEQIALQVAHDLQRQGIGIWMDQLGGLQIGDQWGQGLQEAIDQALGMLIMLSPRYLTSKFCRRELMRGDARGYPLFPLLIEPISTSGTPLVLQDTQYIDLTQWPDDDAYRAGLDTLVAAILHKIDNIHDPDNVLTSTSAPNELYKARQLEDQLADVQGQLQRQFTRSIVSQLKQQRIQVQIEQYVSEYEAVIQQLLVEVNPQNRVRLQQAVIQIEQAIETLDAEITTLDAS